jgi:glutathione gamma-glutamylcysteinyltransferase
MVPPTRYAYLSFVWNRPSTWYCPNVRQSLSTMTQSALPENTDVPALPPIPHINGETNGVDPSAAASSSIPAVSAPPKTTFYRRSLPDTCVAFSSPQGRQYFASAMQHRGLKSYFHLMEQYTTQSEPAFCGISTLVISLNALAVDPRQIWKGSWRWYEESMLNCCIDLEQAKETGITMATFNCLALCQGLSTEVHYVDEAENANPNSTAPSLEHFRARVREACVETDDDDDAAVVDRVLIASYSRRVLKQTGSGHFSPIAAYDEESDTVLIMDTVRFLYCLWISDVFFTRSLTPIIFGRHASSTVRIGSRCRSCMKPCSPLIRIRGDPEVTPC